MKQASLSHMKYFLNIQSKHQSLRTNQDDELVIACHNTHTCYNCSDYPAKEQMKSDLHSLTTISWWGETDQEDEWWKQVEEENNSLFDEQQNTTGDTKTSNETNKKLYMGLICGSNPNSIYLYIYLYTFF